MDNQVLFPDIFSGGIAYIYKHDSQSFHGIVLLENPAEVVLIIESQKIGYGADREAY